MSRQADWDRVSALAGVDRNGAILPPIGVVGIDRSSNTFWKTATTAKDDHMDNDTLGKKHEGLPVSGYKSQSDANVAAVNANKATEERLLRTLDDMKNMHDVDQRWLAVARTHFEQGFMALNRSIFKPGRVQLPEDSDAA